MRHLWFHAIAFLAATSAALAIAQSESEGQGRGRHRGIPPGLREHLSADQITALENAATHAEKRALLDSWGIAPSVHPPLTAEEKAQIDALKAQYDAAATDDEKTKIREQMHEFFKEHRGSHGEVRKFFRDHPHEGGTEGVSKSDASSGRQ